MIKAALFLTLLSFFLGLVSAGTVVLTGTCSNLSPHNTTLLFSLRNSGNETAFNLTAVPFINGAASTNSSYTINSMPPGANDTFAIGISNITEAGAHPARIVTLYTQGLDHFTAVFPCLLYFFNITASELALAIYSSPLQNGNAFVGVTATNLGSNTLYANISLVLPPAFSNTITSQYLNLTPHGSENVTFEAHLLPLSMGGSYSSYGVAVFGSYSHDNLSYAAMKIFSLSSYVPSSTTGNALVLISAIVAVVAIVALILYSLLRKRRRS
ncbi:MAG: hypothetical protein KGH57_03385 [Candidatus Micrarchaeota archaeon]|nr:hypothetical protein [Candidatus Micrarchaeota archaeon]